MNNVPSSFVAEIPLQYPITTAGGVLIEKITLRRGKRADLRAAARFSDNEADQESFLFSRLTGLTMEDLDQIDIADNAELVRRFRDMVGNAAPRSGDPAESGRVAADRPEAAAI